MSIELPFLGLLFTLVFLWLTGLYPGGLIIPSYLVLFLDQPWRIAGTLIAALLTLAAYGLASQFWILFGRRRFVFMVLVGALWAHVGLMLVPHLQAGAMEFRVIGWVIPGLMANQFERQGVVVTLAGVIVVTIATFMGALLLGMR
jgi:poly-gamma-glutamate biosynthesis protein PgsC/CapC